MSEQTLTVEAYNPDTDPITRAMRRAVQAAIKRHKLLGNPIAVADDNGNAVWIQPEDIEIVEYEEDKTDPIRLIEEY